MNIMLIVQASLFHIKSEKENSTEPTASVTTKIDIPPEKASAPKTEKNSTKPDKAHFLLCPTVRKGVHLNIVIFHNC